jgi:hypothetical protein
MGSIFHVIAHDGRTQDKVIYGGPRELSNYVASCAIFVHLGELVAHELYECEDLPEFAALEAVIADGTAKLILRHDRESLARSVEGDRAFLSEEGFVEPPPGGDEKDDGLGLFAELGLAKPRGWSAS